ncbi:MAG: choice-of-anchor D domain-containing protein [Candidatus Sulfotelmatobacter sp.]
MRRCFLKQDCCSGVGLLILCLAMVGCQGFSSGKPATTASTAAATPGSLAASATSLSFGTAEVGSSQSMSELVTNSGGSLVTISQIGISGAGFTLTGVSTPVTVAAGQTFSFGVTFTPQTTGSASGTVTITSNGSNPSLSVAASGSGTTTAPQLTATPATVGVGNVVVGTSGTASGSLNASGADVTITAATANNSQFTISGLSIPALVPAGQSLPFTVNFSPQVTGAASATLTFISSAQTATVTASGTGTAAPTHTVSLSWSASSSPNISGYNVYRAVYTSSCGSYAKINGSTLDSNTVYSDATVADGTNYCYATTAVNSSDEESSYSNILTNVQIPAP